MTENDETLEEMAERLIAKTQSEPAMTPEQEHLAFLVELETKYSDREH